MAVRMTVTLEDDVYRRVQEESARSRKSTKDVVNDAIRTGLQAPRRQRSFGVAPRDLGLRPGLNVDKVADLLDLD
jgi:predicted transcriptional regulator